MEEQPLNNDLQEALPQVPTIVTEQSVESIAVPIAEDYREAVMQKRTSAEMEWQAVEYIEREKSIVWFIVLGVVTIGLLVLAIIVLKQYMFAILVLLMAITVVIWARRPAQDMHYRLENTGIVINGKPFAFHDFRAFGIMQEDSRYNIVLLPIKRFSAGVNIYFPDELGEHLVDLIGSVLPMENIKPDVIDRVMKRLNF